MLPRYAEYSFTLAAGASQALPLTGNFVTCIEASTNFALGIGDEPTTTFREGLSFRVPDGEAFKSLRLENPSASSITVTIGVGRGDLADNRSTIGGTVTTAKEKGATITTGRQNAISSTAILLVPENASRKHVTVWCDATQTTSLTIDGDATMAANNMEIPPGGSYTFDDYTGPIYVSRYGSSGTTAAQWLEVD